MSNDYKFGFPDEWASFQKEHPKFVEALTSLAEVQQKVSKRIFTPKSAAEELVFFSGSVVNEDFSELWLLAGNGCGTGALKILRGMYERTVTAAYMSRFPEEARRFWNYGAVANRRLLNHAKELYGEKQLKELMHVDSFDEAEKAYQEVRHDYEETLCERCNKVRTGFSWSKLGLPAMAKKAGYGLELCYWHAYAIPTQQAHSTVLAITSRLKRRTEARFFERDAERLHTAIAAPTGHVVLLKMLRVQNDFFSLGLDAEIAELEAQCKLVWPGIEDDFGKGM